MISFPLFAEFVPLHGILIERFLIASRHVACVEKAATLPIDLARAIAQCFTNEYIFAESQRKPATAG
jgi:hypothetical protein